MLDPFFARANQNQSGRRLLRLIACVCMFIDHAGKMLFPQLTWMRMVGRLAFPLFAYGIAVGAAMTHHPGNRISPAWPRWRSSVSRFTPWRSGTRTTRCTPSRLRSIPLRALCTFYMRELGKTEHSACRCFWGFSAAVHARKEVCAGAVDLRALRAFFRRVWITAWAASA